MDKKFDVVIVGTGAAGLYAALNFPESVNILLVQSVNFSFQTALLHRAVLRVCLIRSRQLQAAYYGYIDCGKV